MITKRFSDHPVEPWHAIFRGDCEDDYDELCDAARAYGKTTVEMGFAVDYLLILYNRGSIIEAHSIPIDDLAKKRSLLDYYYRILGDYNRTELTVM